MTLARSNGPPIRLVYGAIDALPATPVVCVVPALLSDDAKRLAFSVVIGGFCDGRTASHHLGTQCSVSDGQQATGFPSTDITGSITGFDASDVSLSSPTRSGFPFTAGQ